MVYFNIILNTTVFNYLKGVTLSHGNTCYTVQLTHYSHFKTHSLQHSKPIKC
jgi:hypothetical protein